MKSTSLNRAPAARTSKSKQKPRSHWDRSDLHGALLSAVLVAVVLFFAFALFGCADGAAKTEENSIGAGNGAGGGTSAGSAAPACNGTLTVNSTTYAGAPSTTSGGAVPCDPALDAQQTSNLTITLDDAYSVTSSLFASSLVITTPGAMGTYIIPTGATLVWTLPTGTICTLAAGTVVISAPYPAVGGNVTGTFTGTEVVVGCPATVAGSFTVPRTL
jgi:hypothetical protein